MDISFTFATIRIGIKILKIPGLSFILTKIKEVKLLWYATTPTNEKAKNYDGRRATFLDLESFLFYEDGNKFIVEIQ